MSATLFARKPECGRLLSNLEVRHEAQRLPLSPLSVPRRNQWPQSNRCWVHQPTEDVSHSKSCSFQSAYSHHGEGFTNGGEHA